MIQNRNVPIIAMKYIVNGPFVETELEDINFYHFNSTNGRQR